MYYWNFNQSSSLQSFDENKNYQAELTGAQISADQKYFVIEDQGKFLVENLTSELSGENGFTVSFSARQTGRLNRCHFMPCQAECHICIPERTSKFFKKCKCLSSESIPFNPDEIDRGYLLSPFGN